MESTTQDEKMMEEGAAESAPTPPSTPALEDELTTLRKKLTDSETKAAENLSGWQRERAEFTNYKKRQEQQMSDLRAFATQGLIKRLLPIQDDFERAQKTLPEGISHMTWIEGVMLIQRKLQLLLEGEGVKTVEAKPGDVFDPNVHEAVTHDEAPEGSGIESGHVIEELQKGYKIGEKVIRPALVRVAK